MEKVDFLFVVATPLEARFICEWGKIPVPEGPGLKSLCVEDQAVDLLVTGIGTVNCALRLGAYFATARPDYALQFGIGGAYAHSTPLGSVWEVRSEFFADLGAAYPGGFLDLAQLGFPLTTLEGISRFNLLENPNPVLTQFPLGTGNTVNTTSGEENQIQKLLTRAPADIESMEGGAFFLACLQNFIPFAELRGVSNWVEPRDRSRWNLTDSLANVQEAAWKGMCKILKMNN